MLLSQPLQIDELDNAHDIQGLHEKEAGQNGGDFVVHPRGEGHYARCQRDRRLNAIATRLDRYHEAGSRISQDAPRSDDRIIEGRNDGCTECCKEPREWLNDRLS